MIIFAALKTLVLYKLLSFNYLKMENLFNDIQGTIAAFTKDAALQIEKSNKAAGTRARKTSLELEKLLKDFRKKSLEISKQ
ncbi:MAG: hypothetical protein LBJ23_07180 [Tannerella sp.]|jgi:hypothetical protein|nr:hypothetical protein [Tannerella sp.]